MSTKELTCVVCPSGCRITVTLEDDGSIVSVTGNTCARGDLYARNEVTHPVRTLTTTVHVQGALDGTVMLPVKTNHPLSRDSLFQAMHMLSDFTVQAPVAVGDVLIADFLEKGVDLVACKQVK